MASRLAPSGNFKNPLGLLGRMLLSRKRAAYSALMHEALRRASRPLDAVLQNREQRLLQHAEPNEHPLLLVVGAPRSGTTLVYQTLARYLETSYFSNLTSLFPRSAISASKFFSRPNQPTAADFENFYGQTSGLFGTNDGFVIWNQWLGDDRYSPRTDLTEAEMLRMRRFFDAWTSCFDKPFLNKNNRNTSCLHQLAVALPRARFIVVRRNPMLVAQSLIHARQQVQGDKSIGWGLLASERSVTHDPLAYVDDVFHQIRLIESELDDQLRHVAAERIVDVTYEGFCEDPQTVLGEIVAQIPGIQVHEELVATELKPFQASAKITLTTAERTRLLELLQQPQSSVQRESLCRS